MSDDKLPYSKSGSFKGAPALKTFDHLIQCLYNSVVYAQRYVETEHLKRVIGTYFDDHGRPVTKKIILPTAEGDQEVEIPIMTLAGHNHLKIDNLEMEFEVDLGQFENSDNHQKRRMIAMIGRKDPKNTLAKVKLTIKNGDTPEGIARINDKIVKTIPT
jgi:hypothetical protein|tara:strand:- start:1129 stop:1605 length:477 start_codon:yes stop_codon:yes gene_type:complete